MKPRITHDLKHMARFRSFKELLIHDDWACFVPHNAAFPIDPPASSPWAPMKSASSTQALLQGGNERV